MDKAGAVEQHVDRAGLARERRDLRLVGHIEMACGNQRIGERGKLVRGDVRRQHACPFGGKGERRRAADSLPCGCHQRAFACEPSRHRTKLPRSPRACKSARRS